LSWALYDFANTIFSYVVVTRYFTEWIVIDKGQPDLLIGLMTVSVSLALLVALPSFGALADRLGKHKPLLTSFSLICIAATALLSAVNGVLLALVVAGIAVFAYNSADAQYQPLLAVVAAPEARSRVSGLGAGVGYLGSLGALVGVGALVGEGENQDAFLPTAVLFLALALPCLVLVREYPRAGARLERSTRHELVRVPRDAVRQLAASVGRARGRPHGRLLLARFLYVDALATLVAFISVYARRTEEFSADQISLLLGLATVFAVLGALVAGRLMERFGPKNVLVSTVVGAAAAIFAVGLSGDPWFLWAAAPVVGAAIGSVTACDREYMLRLIPPEHRGEDFGLYALTGRLSNGFGALVLWGGTIAVLTDVFDVATPFEASRVAVCVLAITAVAGLLVLRRVPDIRDPAPTGEVQT
jgi:UMF1 family MFS transporter